MLSLTKFAAIARQYGIPFEVRFTARSSHVWVGGTFEDFQEGSHEDKCFLAALKAADARMLIVEDGMGMTLESLT